MGFFGVVRFVLATTPFYVDGCGVPNLQFGTSGIFFLSPFFLQI